MTPETTADLAHLVATHAGTSVITMMGAAIGMGIIVDIGKPRETFNRRKEKAKEFAINLASVGAAATGAYLGPQLFGPELGALLSDNANEQARNYGMLGAAVSSMYLLMLPKRESKTDLSDGDAIGCVLMLAGLVAFPATYAILQHQGLYHP